MSTRSNGGIVTAMADIASKAAETVTDTVKGAAKSVDPKKGEAAPMHGKIAIVTGGNAGLGFETSKAIAKAGGHVVLAVRNPEKGAEAVQMIQKEVDAVNGGGKVEALHLDLASLRSVHKFAQDFKQKNQQLHVLVNNAGEFVPADQVTEDGFEITTGTNHMGHWYLTQLLVDRLKASTPARIVWVTSPSETSTPDIDWNNLEGIGKQSDLTMYGLTKLYNVLAIKEFQKRLAGTGVETFAAQPGIAKTEIFGKIDTGVAKPMATVLANVGPVIGQTAEEGARAVVYAATNPDMEGKGGDVEHIVGPFYSSLGPATPYGGSNIANIGNTAERPASNDRAYDDEQAARLHDETSRIIGQKIKDFDSDSPQQWV
jgi:NAD(P)-dependent dehydrogenase (short-subunit alcohol dehydrogenase family)